MGGAEGTKLDLDFMEMERVRLKDQGSTFIYLFIL